MKRLLQCASWVVLLGTIAPAVFFLVGKLSLDQCKSYMLVTTVAWFAITPCWMGRETTH